MCCILLESVWCVAMSSKPVHIFFDNRPLFWQISTYANYLYSICYGLCLDLDYFPSRLWLFFKINRYRRISFESLNGSSLCLNSIYAVLNQAALLLFIFNSQGGERSQKAQKTHAFLSGLKPWEPVLQSWIANL